MRISDWSSDVCSSDLTHAQAILRHLRCLHGAQGRGVERPLRREALAQQIEAARRYRADAGEQLQQLALAVAGNAGNANDLPAAHAEADVVDPGDAGAVDEGDILDHENRLAGTRRQIGRASGREREWQTV